MTLRPSRTILLLVWALATLALCAVMFRWAAARTEADVRDAALSRLAADASELQSTLEKFETLPFVMSLQLQVARGLQHPDDASAVAALNDYLVEVQRNARIAAAYVVAPDGMTIAASNWNQPQTFVGSNYRFRPYVTSAMQGGVGRFYGIGTTTAEPGYFLARPVYAPGVGTAARSPVIGVIAIKLNLAEFEHSWPINDGPVALVDANGVIFLSNQASWVYHSLRALGASALAAIDQTQQYAGRQVTPLSNVDAAMSRVAFVEQPVGEIGWRLLRFTPGSEARRVGLSTAVACLLFMTIAGLLAHTLHQRAQHARSTLAARQALVDASAQLEQRIASRTRDLTRANEDLEQRNRELEQAEQLLRQTQNELIQAGKLGMLGQMAAGMTHELSQPLSAVRVFADNAAAFMARDDMASARENLAHISDACARMGHLVGQLKGFARKSHGVLGAVDLARSIENSARLLRSDFEQNGVALDIHVRSAAQVLGDSIRIEQVLINLIRNALDAVKACAEKRVSIELRADSHAEVRISDTGPGIAPQVRQHLFEPFFTTKPSGAGLGLGLAISSSIVQAMDGELLVGHAAAGGAEFTLRLPLADTRETEEASS